MRVEIHDEHFAQDAEDTEWLASVGKRGWIVLTKDGRIRRSPLERMALLNANVGAFILTAGDLRGAAMGALFVEALPKMMRISTKTLRPFIATVAASGSIVIVDGGGRSGAVKK